jgi:hypothetical protein
MIILYKKHLAKTALAALLAVTWLSCEEGDGKKDAAVDPGPDEISDPAEGEDVRAEELQPDTVDIPAETIDQTEENLCAGSPCPHGYTCCFNRYCADLNTDPENCGACAEACFRAVGDRCADAACFCSGSDRACEGNDTDWCCESDGCVDLMSDNDNCGECGYNCTWDQTCLNGWCEDIY